MKKLYPLLLCFCTVLGNAQVTYISGYISSSTNETCPGSDNGSITVYATGGDGSNNYYIQAYDESNGQTYTSGNSNGSNYITLSGIPGGNYEYIIVYDANNPNDGYATYIYWYSNINDNNASCNISVSLGSSQNVCIGNKIILNPTESSGSPPYLYNWSYTGDTLSCTLCQYPNTTITQFSQFSVIVTDAQNNVGYATVSYTPSGSGSVQITVVNNNINCSILADTTTVSVITGNPPYTFNWNDSSSQTIENSPARHTYINPGVYVIEVSDSNGCVTDDIDTVLNLGVNAVLVHEVQPNCIGENTGEIIVAGTGGAGSYTYLWNNGGISNSIANLAVGAYSVTVSDINNCTGQETYYVNAVDGYYYVYLQETDANCANNGSIIPTIYGGRQLYSYLWNNDSTTSSLTGLGSSIYSVNITDSIGCVTSGSTIVNSHCYGTISGMVFADLSNNCIYSAKDYPLPNTIVQASQGGLYYYGFTDENGMYSISVNGSGSFNLDFNPSFSCDIGNLCGNPSQIVTLSNAGDSSLNNNFGVTSTSGFDIGLHPGRSSADPGFQKEYWVYYYNPTAIDFDEVATITFTYDSNLTYQYSLSPLPVHDPVAHTLTWQIDSIPADYWSSRLQNFFVVPSALSTSHLLESDFTITPVAGDCDPSDNLFHFSEVVTGSHDPNEKTVSPSNYIDGNDSVLTYTIYFQNTGTDSTWFITVVDTLSPNLDPATVRNIASSYPYSNFTISGTGILKWTFNPYRLVDSITNSGGSKGFVMFTIKPRSDREAGAIISNRAFIYFDYNSPVMTNTVSDTVAVTAVTTLSQNGEPSLYVFPNPSSDKLTITATGFIPEYLSVYDMDGRKLSEQKFVPQIEISTLPPGVYFIEVSGENNLVRDKVVKM